LRPIDDAIRSFQSRSNRDLAAIDRSTTDLAIARDTPSVHLLHEFTSLRRLWVGGGDASTLEHVSKISSLEEMALVVCRCELPRKIKLPNLRTLLLLDSPTVTHIEPLATLQKVEILGVAGCKKLHDYSPLGKLRSLRQLEIGIRRYYEKMSAASLSFLVSLKKLEHLAVFFTSVVDESIDAIEELARLRTLEISNTFARESLARLAAKLPSTTCRWFQGWQSLGNCPKCDTESLAMMTGKGQRTLCRACQSERFEMKLEEWRELVAAERRQA
jgi:hypothetical protein